MAVLHLVWKIQPLSFQPWESKPVGAISASECRCESHKMGGRRSQNFVPTKRTYVTSVTETRSVCRHCRPSCIQLCVTATAIWHSDVQKHTSRMRWVHIGSGWQQQIQNVPSRKVHTSPTFTEVLHEQDMEDNHSLNIFDEFYYLVFKAIYYVSILNSTDVCALLASYWFLLGLTLNPVDGSYIFLRNAG
jgi:hypothetical protein